MPKLEVASSKSMQDYLRAIAALSNNGDPVSTTEISRYFNIAPASVTEMLQKIFGNGYVSYSSYHGSTLTVKGQEKPKKLPVNTDCLKGSYQTYCTLEKIKSTLKPAKWNTRCQMKQKNHYAAS